MRWRMVKKLLVACPMMTDLLLRLHPKERRGSKPRCHLLTHDVPEEVGVRLTRLIQPWGRVDATDRWMPRRFTHIAEAQLGRVDDLLAPAVGQALVNWWLAVPKGARIPHWDIASTCTVAGQPGLLLIEAKAHDVELATEQAGNRQEPRETANSRRNREHIADCFRQANFALAVTTGLPWSLSIKHHYQMSNRFAWAWKLTELGIPVILVYLGFLNALEMSNIGVPFQNHKSWEELVLAHAEPLFSSQVWNKEWSSPGQPSVPLIRSVELPLFVDSGEM